MKIKIKNLIIISSFIFFLILPVIGKSEEKEFFNLFKNSQIFSSYSLDENVLDKIRGGGTKTFFQTGQGNKIILWDEAKKITPTQLNIFKGNNNIGYSTLIISAK